MVFGDDVKVCDRFEYIIIVDSKTGQEAVVKALMDSIRKLVENLNDKVVFCVDDGENKSLLKKLLEYYARRYKRVFRINKDFRTGAPVAAKGPETKLVTVAMEGRSYADVMNLVKSRVSPEDIGEVLSIRKGTRDEAILRVKGDHQKADEIVATISGKVEGVKVGKLGRPPKKVVVIVKDLEFDVKGTDVVGAIEGVTGEKCLGEPRLRPAYRSTQAARIAVTGKAASILLEQKRIRVGYVKCRVSRSEEVERCFRCHESGHIARNCKGPDRRADCFRCGEKGHKAKDCEGEDIVEELLRRLS